MCLCSIVAEYNEPSEAVHVRIDDVLYDIYPIWSCQLSFFADVCHLPSISISIEVGIRFIISVMLL